LPQPISSRAVPAVEAGFWENAEKAVAAKAKTRGRPTARTRLHAQGERGRLRRRHGLRARDVSGAARFSNRQSALRHVFFAERAAPRPPELSGITPHDIGSAAVIGGGTMGAGIAAALRDAGLPVTLIERDTAAVERGLVKYPCHL
jgi:3-hydroxyacyl-CoA dehydrogenase